MYLEKVKNESINLWWDESETMAIDFKINGDIENETIKLPNSVIAIDCNLIKVSNVEAKTVIIFNEYEDDITITGSHIEAENIIIAKECSISLLASCIKADKRFTGKVYETDKSQLTVPSVGAEDEFGDIVYK